MMQYALDPWNWLMAAGAISSCPGALVPWCPGAIIVGVTVLCLRYKQGVLRGFLCRAARPLGPAGVRVFPNRGVPALPWAKLARVPPGCRGDGGDSPIGIAEPLRVTGSPTLVPRPHSSTPVHQPPRVPRPYKTPGGTVLYSAVLCCTVGILSLCSDLVPIPRPLYCCGAVHIVYWPWGIGHGVGDVFVIVYISYFAILYTCCSAWVISAIVYISFFRYIVHLP